MSHIIYGDESAEQPQVTGDNVRNETAASIKGSHLIKRQIIWGRPNNPRAAAPRSWPVWNGTRLSSFRGEQAQRSGGNGLHHELFASWAVCSSPWPCPGHPWHKAVLERPPQIPGTKPQAADGIPAHLGQRNRLMGDNQPLAGLLGGKLEIL